MLPSRCLAKPQIRKEFLNQYPIQYCHLQEIKCLRMLHNDLNVVRTQTIFSETEWPSLRGKYQKLVFSSESGMTPQYRVKFREKQCSGGINVFFPGDVQFEKENRVGMRCRRNKEGESLKMTIQLGRCGTCVGVWLHSDTFSPQTSENAS